MKKELASLPIIVIVTGFMACNLIQSAAMPSHEDATSAKYTQPRPQNTPQQSDSFVPSDKRIMPSDLEYLGAFRLPDPSGASSWEYSGQGLTYYPAGDPASKSDGFAGSLFGFGHDQQMLVSEISIPIPAKSRNLDELNTAETLQPFSDITGGKVNFSEMQLPVADLQYLASPTDPAAGFLHFTIGQHTQAFEPSQGWSSLDLSNPKTTGLWVLNGYTNYATSDILFDIPPEWANTHVKGQKLATGRFREGVWGGLGPALFAYDPEDGSTPLAPGSTLSKITPLLLYGIQEPNLPDIVTDPAHQMNDYLLADHWTGGAWLTAGNKSAVIFVGTKAMKQSWYGFANGVRWAYDCAEQNPPTCPDVPEFPYENRGYWAEDYQAQMIFYDPEDLADVVDGKLQTWEPQPYATLVLDPNLLNPKIDLAESKRDLVMACTFDREHGLIFIVERLADGYKSIIHIWKINSR